MVVLWCYLAWYCVTVVNHFDPAPRLWLNSLGISLLIGIALVLSVGLNEVRRSSGWVTFRLFCMPFCVSSFAALIKDKDYILFLPPTLTEQAQSLGACAAFVLFVTAMKWMDRRWCAVEPGSGKP